MEMTVFIAYQKNVYCLEKKWLEEKNHWNTNEMNLCKLQLNMPHKLSIYIRTKLCNGGKDSDDLYKLGSKFLCSVTQLKQSLEFLTGNIHSNYTTYFFYILPRTC